MPKKVAAKAKGKSKKAAAAKDYVPRKKTPELTESQRDAIEQEEAAALLREAMRGRPDVVQTPQGDVSPTPRAKSPCHHA